MLILLPPLLLCRCLGSTIAQCGKTCKSGLAECPSINQKWNCTSFMMVFTPITLHQGSIGLNLSTQVSCMLTFFLSFVTPQMQFTETMQHCAETKPDLKFYCLVYIRCPFLGLGFTFGFGLVLRCWVDLFELLLGRFNG